MEFELQGQDHIALNNLLKVLHLVGTGGEANIRISNGEVRVNGEVETRKRRKLRDWDVVEFQSNVIFIRGEDDSELTPEQEAHLEKAIEESKDPKNWIPHEVVMKRFEKYLKKPSSRSTSKK